MATHSSAPAWRIPGTGASPTPQFKSIDSLALSLLYDPALTSVQKTKIMASGPNTSWEIDGETVDPVSGFLFGAPKPLQMVTAAMKGITAVQGLVLKQS